MLSFSLDLDKQEYIDALQNCVVYFMPMEKTYAGS